MTSSEDGGNPPERSHRSVLFPNRSDQADRFGRTASDRLGLATVLICLITSAACCTKAALCCCLFFSESDLLLTFFPRTHPRSPWKRTRLRPQLPASPSLLRPAGPSPGLPRRSRFSRPKEIRTLPSSMRERPTPPPP